MARTSTYTIEAISEEAGRAIESNDYSGLSEERAHNIHCYLAAIAKDQQIGRALSHEWKIKGEPYTQVKNGVTEVVVDVELTMFWEGEASSTPAAQPTKPSAPRRPQTYASPPPSPSLKPKVMFKASKTSTRLKGRLVVKVTMLLLLAFVAYWGVRSGEGVPSEFIEFVIKIVR